MIQARGARIALALWLAGCATAGRVPPPLTAAEHNDLGVAYFRAGDGARAEREFERAVARDPTMVRVLVNLGDARLARGAVREALAAYEAAAGLAPDDAAVANNLAWALLQDSERWTEAEAVIRRALDRRPEPRGYYLDTLGVALLRRGDARGAIESFRAALEDGGLRDGPTRALVLEHAAEAHARAGDLALAERCLGLARDVREAGEVRSRGASGAGVTTVVGATLSVC